MIYLYRCPKCNQHLEQRRPVEDRNKPTKCPYCKYRGIMIRLLTVPQLITNPYHLWQENKFPGSKTDWLEYRRKMDKMIENRDELDRKQRQESEAEAAKQGWKALTPEYVEKELKPEPLASMVQKAVTHGIKQA